jgi:hypothetical protein
MAIFRGLNVAKNMIDIGNPDVALSNLGLRSDNLDLIRNLNQLITREELHSLSGLVDDQRAILNQLDNASSQAKLETDAVRRVESDQVYNYDINNKLIAGTIKYNYVDFNDSSNNWVSKGADISTSRVSSWSPFGPADNPDQLVTYNSDVLNKGEYFALTDLSLTTTPQAKRFSSEVATNKIRLNINGEPVEFPVMRGIPFKITINRLQPSITFYATTPPLTLSNGSFVPFTWVRESVETGEEIGQPVTYTPGSSGYARYYPSISDTVSEEQNIKVFYNPSNITRIYARFHGVPNWPEVTLDNLTHLYLDGNQLEFIPNLDKFTPKLETLDIKRNPIYNSVNHTNDNNLNSDGSDFTGTIQANIDRLPRTLKYLNLEDSLQGTLTQPLDFTHLPLLESPIIGSSTSNPTRAPQLTVPSVIANFASPTLRLQFNPQDSNQFNSSTGVITIVNHQLSNGNQVQYDVRVADDDADADTTAGTLGTVVGGLTAESKYEVHSVSGNTFKLKAIGGSNITYSSIGSGTFHSLVLWDPTANNNAGDIYYNPNVGLTDWDVGYVEEMKFIDNAVMDSKRLDKWTPNRTQAVKSNSLYRFVDDTNATTLAKSNADREFYLATDILDNYTAYYAGKMNILDFSKWQDTLRTCVIYGHQPDPVYSVAQRSITSAKLNPLNVINRLEIQYNGDSTNPITGDVSSAFANKPELTQMAYRSNNGTTMRVSDNFYSGSPKCRHFKIGQSSSVSYDPQNTVSHGNFGLDHDVLGLSGAASGDRTGKLLDPVKSVLTNFEIDNTRYGCAIKLIDTSFGGNDPRAIQISECNNLYKLQITQSHIFGKIPNLTGLAKLRYVYIYNNKYTVSTLSMKEGEAYRMTGANLDDTQSQDRYTNENTSYFYLTNAEMEDMGWKPGTASAGTGRSDSEVVPWGETTLHGSTPDVNDWFTYTPLTANSVVETQKYFILDPTGTSQSQWESLGLPSGTDAAKGVVFTGSSSANRVNLKSAQNGVSYKIIRRGNNTSHLTTIGASSTSLGTTFTANSSATSGMLSSGGYLEKTTPTNYGTGKVIRFNSRSSAFGATAYQLETDPGNEINGLNACEFFRIYNNNFYGNFPTLKQNIPAGKNSKQLTELKCEDNRFFGPTPDLTYIEDTKKLLAKNNDFDSHIPNTLATATKLTNIDLSNNKLPAAAALTIINDLYQNYLDSERDGVVVNLSGQAPGAGVNRCSLPALENDPNSAAEGSPFRKYEALRQHWTITLDDTITQ